MWRNRSILLCRAEATRDGNVDRIGREILDGFRANGWTAVDIVLPTAQPIPALVGTVGRIDGGEFDLVLSVQEMGMFGGSEIDAIMARGGARRLYWALDHPYSCWQTVASLATKSIVTTPTRGNVHCFERFLRHDLKPIMVAHGAAPREAAPWSARTIPALFVGNAPATPPDRLRQEWPDRHPALWAGLLDEMAVRFDPFASDSLHDLALDAMAACNIDPATIQRSDIMGILGAFDAYAWARARLDYIWALRETPVTLVGRGWDGIADGAMKAIGPLPTEKSRALMDHASLVLNLLPAWYRSHERVFEGMAAGCAVATTGVDDVDAILALGPLAGAGERLNELLADSARLQSLGEAGRAELRARHSWAHRVAALLDAIAAAG